MVMLFFLKYDIYLRLCLAAKNTLTHANSRKVSAYNSLFWVSKSRNEVQTGLTGVRRRNQVLLIAG